MKSIYVDGAPAEDSKPSQSAVGNSVAFLIGGVHENGVPKSRLNGMVDEVQIYNHALTDSDVQLLFENPTATALSCEQKAAAMQQQLADAQATIANLQNQLAANENELAQTDDSLVRLTLHMRSVFRDGSFQINGTTTSEQTESLVDAIERMNRGSKQILYYQLKTQP